MTRAAAIRLVLLFDGSIAHADQAGLSAAEELALRLTAAGASAWLCCRGSGLRRGELLPTLASAEAKLLRWHAEVAKEVLETVDNKSINERPTFIGPSGEEEELKGGGGAPPAIAAHPDLKPSVSDLVEPQRAALSVLLTVV